LGQNDLRTQPIWLIPVEFGIQQAIRQQPIWNQGSTIPGSDRACRWHGIQSVHGWGDKGVLKITTAGWLSFSFFLNQMADFDGSWAGDWLIEWNENAMNSPTPQPIVKKKN